MRPINEIIVHCTATQAKWRANDPTSKKVSEIKLWHTRDRGWKDIGYHYLIDRDGTVATGRPLDQVGAHVQGHNTGTVGISLFGGFGSNEKDQFAHNFTPEQDLALRGLIAKLQAEYPAIQKISGHNEYAAKACPGFNVTKWLSSPATPAKPPAQAHKPDPAPVTTPKANGFWAALFEAIAAMFRGR